MVRFLYGFCLLPLWWFVRIINVSHLHHFDRLCWSSLTIGGAMVGKPSNPCALHTVHLSLISLSKKKGMGGWLGLSTNHLSGSPRPRRSESFVRWIQPTHTHAYIIPLSLVLCAMLCWIINGGNLRISKESLLLRLNMIFCLFISAHYAYIYIYIWVNSGLI